MVLVKRLTLVTISSALALCALAAYADPADDALDAIGAKLQANDTAGALAALDGLGSLRPVQLVRARYYRASAHNREGKRETASQELRAFVPPQGASAADRAAFATSGGPYGQTARYLLAQLLGAEQRPDQMKALCCEIAADCAAMAAQEPGGPEWQSLQADALFSAERYAEAADAYGRFAARFPDHPKAEAARFRKAEALRMDRRYQEEYDYLQTLKDGAGPEREIRAAVKQAELLAQYMRKDFETSNRLCEDLIAKYPEQPSAFLAKCRLARNYLYDLPAAQRNPAKARALLQELVADYPRDPMAFEMKVDIANCYSAEKDFGSAIRQYTAVLAEYRDEYPANNWHAHVRYLLADAYKANGQTAAADAAWRQIVAQYPNDSWASLADQRLQKEVAR